MICPHCHTELNDDATRCHVCGLSLVDYNQRYRAKISTQKKSVFSANSAIKGVTKDLYMRKNQLTTLTTFGKQVDIEYSNIKRIDYFYGIPTKSGFIDFITADSVKEHFEISFANNDFITNVIKYFQREYPSVEISGYTLDDLKSRKSVTLHGCTGYQNFGLSFNRCIMHQEKDGRIYFNNDTTRYYSLIDYEWQGPVYETITTANIQSDSISISKTSGKSTSTLGGAAIGSLFGPAGMIAGAMVGSSGKKKNKSNNSINTKGIQKTKNIEKDSLAFISLRNTETGKINRLSFICNTALNTQIKCLSFEQDISYGIQAQVSEHTGSLEDLKTLKELLDLGAITPEEFSIKKKQILNLD